MVFRAICRPPTLATHPTLIYASSAAMAKPTNDELKQLISNVLSKVTTVEGEVSLLKVDLARLHVAVSAKFPIIWPSYCRHW